MDGLIVERGEKKYFDIMSAIYVEEYGNPLLEALPDTYTFKELQKKEYVSRPTDEEKALDYEQRVHSVERIFDCMILPPKSERLIYKIDNMLRKAYINRQKRDTPAQALALCSVSGMGKKTILKYIRNLYPTHIMHTIYQGRPYHMSQIPIISCSVKDREIAPLAKSIVRPIEEMTHINLCWRLENVRNTGDYVRVLGEMMHEFGVGMLMILEFSYLEFSQIVAGDIFVLLSSLVREYSVAVVITGGRDTEHRIRQRDSLNYLFSSGGFFDVKPFEDGNWDSFIKRIWDCQWFSTPVPFTKELGDIIFEYSEGKPQVALRIFADVQIAALLDHKETFDADDLLSMARNNTKYQAHYLDDEDA